jgi:alkylation response protein AidB-like acyl-CoA dehydrogenase
MPPEITTATASTDPSAGDGVAEDPRRAEFRARVREFLAAHARRRRRTAAVGTGAEPDPAAAGIEDAPEAGDDITSLLAEEDDRAAVERARAFQAAAFDAGLAGIMAPKEYGGQGLSLTEQLIWNEEAAAYEIPTMPLLIGHGMCFPTVLVYGTPEQRERFLRPLLRGDEVWCQLFSEPGAGSDVASLQTRAVRDGDEWIVNGQKVWTSGAHYSDYGILIARTDPDVPKHLGITMFILDMHAPGVTVKPLRQITGGANFNEVFFDDVRIPHSMVLGEVGGGWRAAITTLMNERVAIGAGGAGGGGSAANELIRTARRRGVEADPVVRQGIADVFVRERILSYVGQRIRAAVLAGRDPGPEGSVAKLAGTVLGTRVAALGLGISGASGIAWPADDRHGERWSTAVVGAPGAAIAGGTSEVMKNIIGERVLGLPKEPQVDRDVPFRDLLVGTQRG